MVMNEIRREVVVPNDIEIEFTSSTPVTFSELYGHEFVSLVRMATLMTGNAEAARDIVQDAFVKLHVRWSTVHHPPAYVRRSVVNGCKSHHRREGRRRRDDSLADQAANLEIDHTLATLDTLNHRQRAIVILKYYEGRSETEIAEIVGCRPGSVGPTLQRALTKLRELQS